MFREKKFTRLKQEKRVYESFEILHENVGGVKEEEKVALNGEQQP